MNKRKNILFIVSRLPVDLATGDRLRVYHFIKGLKKRGHRIDILGFVPATQQLIGTDIKDLCNKCIGIKKAGIEFKSPDRQAQLQTFFESLFQHYPYRVWQWYDREFIDRAGELVEQNNYDVIHFSAPPAGIAFHKIREMIKSDKPRIIYDLIDSFSLLLKKSLTVNISLFPFRFVDQLRFKKFERDIVHQADCTILISERDKQYIGIEDKVSIIPNGVAKITNTKKSIRDIDLLFVGNMASEANIDAARWFAQKVMSEIWKQNLSVHFFITGANPPLSIQQLESDKITVTGYVDDINEYYRRAKIFVCPMRLGAGQKNKILEAMINRSLVISTAEGNIGINAPEGTLVIADTAEEFSSQISLLLEDDDRRKRIADDGYNFVRSNFSWKRSIDLLEQCYEQ